MLGKSRQLSCGEEYRDVVTAVAGRKEATVPQWSGQKDVSSTLRPFPSHQPAAPQEKHLEGLRTEPKGEALLEPLAWPPARHSHLHILDAIAVSVVITLVPDAVIVCIFLSRIGRQAAVVLQAQPALGTGRRQGLERGPAVDPVPCTPCAPPPGAHLLAVLVVVDAGQGLVWVPIQVCVLPAHVAVAGPAHIALNKDEIRGWKEPWQDQCCHAVAPHTLLLSLSPAHRTGDLPVPLEQAEAVDVAGVGGGSAAGLLRDAAGRLVPHKARLAGPALVGALGERGQGWDEGS